MLKQWGYTYIDEIVWVKSTVNGNIAKGHGFYLQHSKETCFVGIKVTVMMKGNPWPRVNKENKSIDTIFSQRRGQSQKPDAIYELIEDLLPNGSVLKRLLY